MRISIVAGADGASFVHALSERLGPDDSLTVVVPVAQDRWETGLKASPDLDALLQPPTATTHSSVAGRLIDLGYSPSWQRPSDDELALRLIRSDLLAGGYSLTETATALATRLGLRYRVLPVSDERAELFAVVERDGQQLAVHISEQLATAPDEPLADLVLVAQTWLVSDQVAEAVSASDALVIGPSSRTLAIDPVLRAPGFAELVRQDMPVLVTEYADPAPVTAISAAGQQAPDPGTAEYVTADPDQVLNRLRELVTA